VPPNPPKKTKLASASQYPQPSSWYLKAETPALQMWIAERAGVPRVSSRLLRIEMLRSIARNAPDG